MDEYNSNAYQAQNTQGTSFQQYQASGSYNVDHGENIERMLIELINIHKGQHKQIKALRSYCAVISLVAGIQLIGWILSLLGIIRLFG